MMKLYVKLTDYEKQLKEGMDALAIKFVEQQPCDDLDNAIVEFAHSEIEGKTKMTHDEAMAYYRDHKNECNACAITYFKNFQFVEILNPDYCWDLEEFIRDIVDRTLINKIIDKLSEQISLINKLYGVQYLLANDVPFLENGVINSALDEVSRYHNLTKNYLYLQQLIVEPNTLGALIKESRGEIGVLPSVQSSIKGV